MPAALRTVRRAHDVDAFRLAYRQAVADVMPFLSDDRLEVMARHNPGWKPSVYDNRGYLVHSESRYVAALERFPAKPAEQTRVLEVGGFMGAWPLALARLGYDVTLSEKYGYYYGAFDPLRDYLTEHGVGIWDLDLTEAGESLPGERFDVVTVLALLEHLAHSPRALMDNTTALAEPGGRLIYEVPNIAYWPKRVALMRGMSPHSPLEHVYEAEIPFTGHHREYTIAELTRLLEWSGLEVIDLITYNYYPWPPRSLFIRLVGEWPSKRFKSMRDVIMATAVQRSPNT